MIYYFNREYHRRNSTLFRSIVLIIWRYGTINIHISHVVHNILFSFLVKHFNENKTKVSHEF